MSATSSADPRIAIIVAAAPPLTPQAASTIAALRKSVVDSESCSAPQKAPKPRRAA